MDIIQYLLDNHDQTFYLIGGVSLVVELALLGLGGPLLFFGLAAFFTGALSSFGVISGWDLEIFTLAISTAILAIVLWRPLRNFQNAGGGPDTSSDMIGLNVPAATDISRSGGKIRYSGIDWNARLSVDAGVETIAAKELCIIVGVKGTTMLVELPS
jgi:membrane protein implicated in regulation of membrane protease activity|tara:strand:- start:7113 stop:7583 length:471 start_codon:yes stop_codon:yes gene_type:complete